MSTRSNSFDLNQNKPLKSQYQKKISDEDFQIIKYEEYENIKYINYTVNQLKKIAKYYKLKSSGNKASLRESLYYHLKGSLPAILIQKIWRKYLIKSYIECKGPACLKRSICVNSSDFYSLEDIKTIQIEQFISYQDNDNFIYGFDLQSINELLKQNNKQENPYNRNKIPLFVKYNLKKLIRLSRILKRKININIDFAEVNNNNQESIRAKVVRLFQVIDSFGHTTDVRWFNNLDRNRTLYFLRELHDIWSYRAGITPQTQREIAPNGTPFSRNSINYLYANGSLEQIQRYTLNVIDKLINTGINDSSKCLGIYYVLSAFTLASPNAAISLPWLYESVQHQIN